MCGTLLKLTIKTLEWRGVNDTFFTFLVCWDKGKKVLTSGSYFLVKIFFSSLKNILCIDFRNLLIAIWKGFPPSLYWQTSIQIKIIVTDFNYPSSSTIKFSVQFNEVCFLSSCLLELKTKLFKKKIDVNIENFKNI